MTTTDLIIQWSVAALVGVVLLARGRLTLFHPATLYLAFHVVAFCLRPTLIAWFEFDAIWKSIGLAPEPEHLRDALRVSSAGLGAFTAAFLLGSWRADPIRPAAPREMDRSDTRALLLTAALAAIPGFGSAAYAHAATSHSGYAVDLQLVMVPVALLLILLKQWRWWSLLPLAAISWARAASDSTPATVLTVLVLLAVVWLWSHQRRLPSVGFMVASCLIAVAALLFGQYRSSVTTWLIGGEAPGASSSPDPMLAAHLHVAGLAHFEALSAIVSVVPDKSGGFSHGSQHAARLNEALPWRPAPGPTTGSESRTIDLNRHGNFRTVPTPLVGDGWINGGWTGVVVTLALVGLLFGSAFKLYSRHQDDPIAACLLATFQAIGLQLYQGSDLGVVRISLMVAAPLFVWRLLASRFRRAETAAAERDRLREERQRRRLLGTALLNPHAASLPPGALAGGPDAEGFEDEPESEHDMLAGTTTPDNPRATPAPSPNPDADPAAQPSPRPPARWRSDEPR